MIDKRLLSEVPKAKKYVIKQVGMQWVSLLCNICFVFLLADVFVNILAKTMEKEKLLYVSLIVFVLVLIRVLVTRKAGYYSHMASCDVKEHLRARLYTKLLELKNDYTNHVATSELVQLSVEGIDQLETYFGRYLPQLFYSMLAPVTLFFVLVWFDWKSAVVLFLCVPLIPLSIIAIQTIAKRLLSKYWSIYASLGDSFLENLQGLTTLKIYQADAFKNEEMNKEAEHFRKITMKVLTMQLNSVSVMDVIAYGGAAIGSIIAIVGFANGNVSLFAVISIVLLSAEFFLPLRLLGSFFHIAMNGIAASGKIFKLLDVESVQMSKGQLEDVPTSISLTDVSFSYEEDRSILQNIHMDIQPHQCIAIAGESGSGKSTIAKLIVGLSKQYKGSLTLQGKERKDINDDSFYKKVMYVTHKPMIFKGTIRENLQIARTNITEEDMWEALKKVQLSDFIMSMDGLDTKLLEQGSNFSGGQNQRLSMARALLSDREVYIFDEATSNIDVESEDTILKVIHALAKEKTIIMITHRLANIVNSDYIYVLHDGRCVEHGTHDNLVTKDQVYATLYKKQKELEEYQGGKVYA